MSLKLWWKSDKGNVYKSVFETLEGWEKHQSQRGQGNLRNLKLYGNSEVLGLRLGEFQRIRSLNRVTMNVIQSSVDTATARIAKSKPKAMFMTEEGDHTLRIRAKNLERYTSGQYYSMDMYKKGRSIFRDGCVFGDGFIKFFDNNGKLDSERVFPEEIKVDEDEAVYGNPRHLHHVKYVSKDCLIAIYPKMKGAIENSTSHGKSYMLNKQNDRMLKVVESWRLPDGPKANNGRHTITTDKCDLLDEKWEHEFYPFEKWSWSERLLGYWGQGISEQLTGIQIEINKILKNIQICTHIGLIPKVLIDESSEIVSSHLNNEIGGIIKYRGIKPDWSTMFGVPAELFMQLENLYEKAFELVGLSRMSVGSSKPAGLNSGKALRTFSEIESERFAVVSQEWENFHMRCHKKIIQMSKIMAEKYPKLEVTTLDNDGLYKIKWKDINLEEDQYFMKLYPKNFLSDTPQGKLEDVRDLIDMGLIEPKQAKALLSYPDLDAHMSLDNSVIVDIDGIIDGIVSDGEYDSPVEAQDLEYMLPYMRMAYVKYRRSGLEDERLDLFSRWIDDALMILSPPEIEGEEIINNEVDEDGQGSLLEDQEEIEAMINESGMIQQEAM